MKKIIKHFILAIGVLAIAVPPAQAQDSSQVFKGEVAEIKEQGQEEMLDQQVDYQVLSVRLPEQTVEIRHDGQIGASFVKYEPGDKVWARVVPNGPEPDTDKIQYVITDRDRTPALVIIALIFVAAVLAVSKLKGLRAIFSLLISFGVIFQIMLPLLVRGWQPVTASLLTAVIIIPVSFYLSHGWNKKTHVAVGGTALALLLSIFLAVTFVNNAHLTGFASEEAGLLNVEQQGSLDIQGLLLAGLIIGLLGTLDDITISQSAFVFQMNQDNPDLSLKKLYQKAMKIGQDHIASMVNTLVLVYAGSALPLLLLFINNPQPIAYILNQEIIAEEIIRTLIGSIGLILAAPLTTFLAAAVAKSKELTNLIK